MLNNVTPFASVLILPQMRGKITVSRGCLPALIAGVDALGRQGITRTRLFEGESMGGGFMFFADELESVAIN